MRKMLLTGIALGLGLAFSSAASAQIKLGAGAPITGPNATFGAQLVELSELLRISDTVTLHAPVTPSTIGMLGAAEFALMKDGSLFVNTARGRLIDHERCYVSFNRVASRRFWMSPIRPNPCHRIHPFSPWTIALYYRISRVRAARHVRDKDAIASMKRFDTCAASRYVSR